MAEVATRNGLSALATAARSIGLFFFLLLVAARALAGSVNLAWDPPTGPAPAGYKVYYGPAAGNYPSSVDVGSTTSYTVSGLAEGVTYHFAATDYDVSHTESGFSNDVSATVKTPRRILVPDGTSEKQVFVGYPETRWFAMTVEPGKTYVIDAVDPSGELTANAMGTLGVFAPDGVSAPPEASVDCTGANGPRPPAVDVASDGIRCVLRTALPTAGMQQNKRPVYVKVTRADPVLLGGGAQFKIRARESTIYGRWVTNGYAYHVEVENTTGDAMCVEVARYPASGLTYTTGPGWSGSIASFQMTVPAFGAVKQVIPNGSLVGGNGEGTLRVNACAMPTNLIPGALHVSTYAFDPVSERFLYFLTSTANEGKTRSTW